MTQKDQDQNTRNVIAYASRALSQVEQRYPQTEKEALAIVWGIEHFHLFLFGADFILITDHKPLQLIYNNSRSRPLARIERWFLRLQQYNFHVIYKAGSENPADFLSRHAEPKIPKRNVAEDCINYISVNTAQDAIPLEVIKLHTNTDPNLNAVCKAVESGDWSTDRVKPFRNIKEEITVDHANGILLRGTRIIIPSTLQANIISLAHKGHQVLAKTKASLREYAWFPSCDKAVKDELETWLPCQITGPTKPPEPLQTPEMADGP